MRDMRFFWFEKIFRWTKRGIHGLRKVIRFQGMVVFLDFCVVLKDGQYCYLFRSSDLSVSPFSNRQTSDSVTLIVVKVVSKKMYTSIEFKIPSLVVLLILSSVSVGCAGTLQGVKADLKSVGQKTGLSSSDTTNAAVENTESEPSVLTKIQTLLKEKGYYEGEINGNFTATTEAAIQDYQLDKGLRIDGRANKELLAVLEAG